MRSLWLGVLVCAVMFVACGDDDSDFATRPSDDSSSSMCEDCDDESSSSVTPKSSSSSKVPEPAEKSSSSTKSSSSIDSSNSSSSDSDGSSSSIGEEASSSSSVELNCSALLEGTDGWSWDVPKECRLNSAITYGTMTDSRDNKVYKIVKIGDQTWMAENLNYSDSIATSSLLGKSWCYDNKEKNCNVAGRLYTWGAAIDSVKLATDADNPQNCGYYRNCTLPAKVQGICPPGWHLPTKTEWNTLFAEVGGSSTAGKILKSQTDWYVNGNGTDALGFSALPAGCSNGHGEFLNDGYDAYFWSATENVFSSAYRVNLYCGDGSAYLGDIGKYYAYSVRCVKDNP